MIRAGEVGWVVRNPSALALPDEVGGEVGGGDRDRDGHGVGLRGGGWGQKGSVSQDLLDKTGHIGLFGVMHGEEGMSH